MALTPMRWLAVAVMLGGVAALVILREPAAPTRNTSPEYQYHLREERAAAHAGAAAERLVVLKLLDSVRRANPNAMGAPPFRVLVSANASPRVRLVSERLAALLLPRRPVTPEVPVDLVLLVDTATRIRGVPLAAQHGLLRTDYALPTVGTNDRCVVLTRTKELAAGRRYSDAFGDLALSKLLGPCAYYEAFGHPGPRIDAWLRRHAWNYGLSADWNRAPTKWKTHPWYYGAGARLQTFYTDDWIMRRAITSRGYRCAAGDVSSCDSALFDRRSVRSLQSAKVWEGDLVTTRVAVDQEGDRNYWWATTAEELGPREWELLAAVVHDFGPDPFRQFWQSREEPRVAFRAATGHDFAEWTREWAQRTYGVQHRGPGIALAGAGYGVGVIGLALAMVMFTARRRSIS